jgi:hypothetical protein
MKRNKFFINLITAAVFVAIGSCSKEDSVQIYKGVPLEHFPTTKGSYFVFQDSDPGFDLVAGTTKPEGQAKIIIVTIDLEKSTAVEGVDFTMPTKQITVAANEVIGSVKIIGNFNELTSAKKLVFNLTEGEGTAVFNSSYELTLQQFCPYNQSDFIGSWQFTSDPDNFGDTWTVEIIAGSSPNELIVKDLYNQGYDSPGYDIILILDDTDPSNFKVTAAKQVAWNSAMFGLSYGLASVSGSGTFSACSKTISIFLNHSVAAGSFGTFEEKFVKL